MHAYTQERLSNFPCVLHRTACNDPTAPHCEVEEPCWENLWLLLPMRLCSGSIAHPYQIAGRLGRRVHVLNSLDPYRAAMNSLAVDNSALHAAQLILRLNKHATHHCPYHLPLNQIQHDYDVLMAGSHKHRCCCPACGAWGASRAQRCRRWRGNAPPSSSAVRSPGYSSPPPCLPSSCQCSDKGEAGWSNQHGLT